MKAKLYMGAAFAIGALAFVYALTPSEPARAQEQTLLSGKVTSSTGEAARRHSDQGPSRQQHDHGRGLHRTSKGEYSFPAWSDLTPGSYSVAVELPDFEHVKRDGVVRVGRAERWISR